MARMAKYTSAWARIFERSVATITRTSLRAGTSAATRALQPTLDKRKPPPGAGDWIPGIVMGAPGVLGTRRFRLYRPPDARIGERLPLMVMLHGCGQDAKSFATSTRMNHIAARERFLVLYPEQDRCRRSGRCTVTAQRRR